MLLLFPNILGLLAIQLVYSNLIKFNITMMDCQYFFRFKQKTVTCWHLLPYHFY